MNISIRNHNLGVHMNSLGIALSIAGVPLGMYMNQFIASRDWNFYIMLLSAILIPNWRLLMSWRFPSMSNTMRVALLFLLLCLFYGIFFPGYKTLHNPYKHVYILVYILFSALYCLELGAQQKHDIDFHMIIKYTWGISMLCTLCALYCIRSGVYDVYARRTTEETVLSSLTMGYGCVYGFICSLYYPTKSGWRDSLISVISAIACFVAVVWIGKRTPFLVCIFVFLIYIKNFNPFKKKSTTFGIVTLTALIGIYVMFMPSEDLISQLDTVYLRSSNGISDMVYGTTTSGTAANARFESRVWCVNYISSNFTLFNGLFGWGFMKRWLDIPSLQSYLDMGIIGFCAYNYFVVILPISVMFKRKYRKNYIILFAAAICVYPAISTLNSGHPYGPSRLMSFIFLLFTISYYYKWRTKNNQISAISRTD